MTMTFFFRVGDSVSVNHPKYPGVWIVESTGPVNAVLTPEGGGRRLRAPKTLLVPPGETTVSDTATTSYFSCGELVRIDEGRYAGLYVVIADKGNDKVNVAKLGGDGGAYVRAYRGSLTPVSLDEVTL